MNMLNAAELTRSYSDISVKKTEKSAAVLLLSGAGAGAFVALTGCAMNTLAHGTPDTAGIKLITGAFFPFALIMVILLGLELFTSNCLISVAVLDKRASVGKMIRNLALVYCGNFAGSFLVAAGCFASGQFDYSAGLLSAYTIKAAAAKCDMDFLAAVGLGVFCNILVCAAALCANTAKDTAGRVLGAYGPVAVFVFAGFEHSIANMYYIPAGLLAKTNPVYANAALAMGVDIAPLTVGNFLLKNLLPVTLGNIIGGVLVGFIMWRLNAKHE
ncbi:MAG: formate/nitrite transporter family protein [Clostridiales bacterium]|jgi:formate/nitrite transporter|nr:formate/nitrite transporter family protein [Clostridiales bacterium]